MDPNNRPAAEFSRPRSQSPTLERLPQEQIIPLSSNAGISIGSPVFTTHTAPTRSDTISTRPVSRESRTSTGRALQQPIGHNNAYTSSMKLESVEDHTESGSSSSHPLPPLPVTNSERHGALGEGTPIAPLPRALHSSRNTMLDMNDDEAETYHQSHYSVPRTRRVSLGPEKTLERPTSTMPMSMRSATGTTDVEDKPYREKTVAERLEPTLRNAISEKSAYATKARLTGYALNIAIGLQVVLGTLTTALSVILRGSSETATMTAILGGLSTIVASYLARTRGSNEPELSITRVKDLEQFIRECESLKLDHGHLTGERFDAELERLRNKFEELLGNGNGERKLSPPA